MSLTGQLPLLPPINPSFKAHDFREAASNAAALAWLSRTPDWPNKRLALWGEAGCGKTHLLHVWANRVGAPVLSGQALQGLPEIPAAAGIAIDDADGVTDETALFHLLNAAGEAGLAVLLAARTPPARWNTKLPDLASRLRAITAVEIGPPEDTLLRALLARLLADRQLRPTQAVRDWMLSRLPRNAVTLRDAVARLDDAAMDTHRTITVPFAREVLADLLAPDEFSGSDEAPSRHDPSVL